MLWKLNIPIPDRSIQAWLPGFYLTAPIYTCLFTLPSDSSLFGLKQLTYAQSYPSQTHILWLNFAQKNSHRLEIEPSDISVYSSTSPVQSEDLLRVEPSQFLDNTANQSLPSPFHPTLATPTADLSNRQSIQSSVNPTPIDPDLRQPPMQSLDPSNS